MTKITRADVGFEFPGSCFHCSGRRFMYYRSVPEPIPPEEQFCKGSKQCIRAHSRSPAEVERREQCKRAYEELKARREVASSQAALAACQGLPTSAVEPRRGRYHSLFDR